MSFVSRDRMEQYEEYLKDFDFDWQADGECSAEWAAVMKEQEWKLLIEAEGIGSEAVELFRRYQVGLA